ncbi:MAG: hypothetical protein QM767_26025 [Anaeromyxobacter sp.]
MSQQNTSSRSCAIVALGLLALALPGCATKDRPMDQLMKAEDGGDGGKTSAGKGGAQGGSTPSSATSAPQGGTTTDASSVGGQGGSFNSNPSSNGGTQSTTDTLPAGGTAGTTAQGGQGALGGSAGLGGAGTTGGSTSSGGTSNVGGSTTTRGGSTNVGGTTNSGGTTGQGGTTTATTTAPLMSVVVTSASVANGATTSLTTASFTFGSSPSGATRYECKPDSGSYADCTSGLTMPNLGAGTHSFTVRAYNSANVAGPELSRSWTVGALSTTIHAIREGKVPVDSLVTVSTGVRLSGMIEVSGNQMLFIRETELKYTSSIETATDLVGDPALNSAIMTRPAVSLSLTRAAGWTVTVTGVFKNNLNNAELVKCTYSWGSLSTAYQNPYFRNNQALTDGVEGMRVRIAGDITTKGCDATPCYRPGSNDCIYRLLRLPPSRMAPSRGQRDVIGFWSLGGLLGPERAKLLPLGRR